LANFNVAPSGIQPVSSLVDPLAGTSLASSWTAVAASALFELSGYVADPDRQRYLEAALEIVDELASPAYLSEGTSSQAILLHGSVSVPDGEGIDVGPQRRRPLFSRSPRPPEVRALIRRTDQVPAPWQTYGTVLGVPASCLAFAGSVEMVPAIGSTHGQALAPKKDGLPVR
jgi:hypothetical protein